jgi:hypothetical protein
VDRFKLANEHYAAQRQERQRRQEQQQQRYNQAGFSICGMHVHPCTPMYPCTHMHAHAYTHVQTCMPMHTPMYTYVHPVSYLTLRWCVMPMVLWLMCCGVAGGGRGQSTRPGPSRVCG